MVYFGLVALLIVITPLHHYTVTRSQIVVNFG